jgi:alpha/beta superfamily hydrolase
MSIHDEQKKVATGITDGTHKQEQGEPLDLASAIEYADARWDGVDVPAEWLRHFVDGLLKEKNT